MWINIYIKHLAVEKTDRLTRNFRDAVTLSDWMDANEERRLHAVKENLIVHKYSKSDVNFVWGIQLMVAKKYTENLREEAMKGWAEKLAQGWMPAPPPPGYMTEIVSGKRIHVPNPDTAPVVQQMFRKYLEPGQSYATIVSEMYRLGIKTKNGRPFNKSKAHKILSNPYYIGTIQFNGKEYPGAQQHLITKDLFDQVQYKSHYGRPKKFVRHNAPLKGMIFCQDCHTVVTWQLQKGKYYGACRRSSDLCRITKLLRHDEVEQKVSELLNNLVCPSKEVMDWVSETMREHYQNTIENQRRIEHSLRDQLDRIKRMDNTLYDDKLAGEITVERYAEKHESLMNEKAQITSQLSVLGDTMVAKMEQRFAILELTQRAAQIYPHKTPEQKRLILSKLFTQMTISDGILSVKYTKFAETIGKKVQETTKLMEVVK